MKLSQQILTLTLCVLLCQHQVLAAIINTTPTPTAARTTLTTTSTGASNLGANLTPISATNGTRPVAGATIAAPTQPTMNFNFGSMFDRSSAQNAVTQTRSSWNNFFT